MSGTSSAQVGSHLLGSKDGHYELEHQRQGILMNVYTYSEARRRLAAVLDEAREAGEVRITRRDGSSFVLRPIEDTSPLDGIEPVEGIHLSLEDIMDSIRESRARGYDDSTTS